MLLKVQIDQITYQPRLTLQQRRVQDTEHQLALAQYLVHTKSPRLYLAILGVQTDHQKIPGIVAVTWCESDISEHFFLS